jgi:hypothetical protein
MPILDKPKCPKCDSRGGIKHCVKSNYCNWFRCTKCTPKSEIIFSKDGRYFVWSAA